MKPCLGVLFLILVSMTSAFGQEPVKVHTQGLTAKIQFEHVLSGFLTEFNGTYKLRVTELTLAPGGTVGENNHVGPGIRLVTSGQITYVLPEHTVVYKPGESRPADGPWARRSCCTRYD